jgi:hypothetical protein
MVDGTISQKKLAFSYNTWVYCLKLIGGINTLWDILAKDVLLREAQLPGDSRCEAFFPKTIKISMFSALAEIFWVEFQASILLKDTCTNRKMSLKSANGEEKETF